jgi:CHAD domain-containing protein
LESKVLKGNSPNAIHDIRVASRRLQQILDLLYPSPPPRIRKLRRGIRRCRKALSEVRNHDVLLIRCNRVLGRKGTLRREAWEAFRDYVEGQRKGSFRKASRRVAKLSISTIYVRLRENLGLYSRPVPLETAGSPISPGDGNSDAQLRHRMGTALRETWSSLQDSLRKALEKQDAPALHGVRIAAKKTRYLIEVMHMLHAPGSDQALRWLRRVQRQLGDWHDLEVLEQAMLEMVANSGILEERLELAMDVERLVLKNRKRKTAKERIFFQSTESSGEWERLGNWVRDYSGVDAAGPVRIGARDHSAAFPPSTT